jgi:hypothetical protein
MSEQHNHNVFKPTIQIVNAHHWNPGGKHSYAQTPRLSLTHLLTHLLIPSLPHLISHSLPHLITHPLTYSLTSSPHLSLTYTSIPRKLTQSSVPHPSLSHLIPHPLFPYALSHSPALPPINRSHFTSPPLLSFSHTNHHPIFSPFRSHSPPPTSLTLSPSLTYSPLQPLSLPHLFPHPLSSTVQYLPSSITPSMNGQFRTSSFICANHSDGSLSFNGNESASNHADGSVSNIGC